MKETKTFGYCEQCNKAIELVSPPTKEQYAQGLIKIKDATVLFSDELADARVKGTNFSASHCGNFEGLYCDKTCLLEKIEELLRS